MEAILEETITKSLSDFNITQIRQYVVIFGAR